MTVGRVVIAAPASGSGKTTVATGLMAALTARGCRVAPFKVGPDYIDPGYHTIASGRPGRNLDPVLVREDRIRPLFAHGAKGADLAVIEGVMGLFDGRSTRSSAGDGGSSGSAAGFGSTAHVARLLEAPVVLVVDARGQGRSVAALLHGFRGYDPTVRLAGVVLNQVGSARHEQVLREACDEVALPVLGAVPRGAEVALPSRHLGLIPAVEHGEPALRAVAAMGDLIARSVDLDAIRRLAATAGRAAWPAWDAGTEIAGTEIAGTEIAEAAETDRPGQGGRPVVAVAGGAAFTFGYREHIELLQAAGADVVVVDPLRDASLPEGTAALVLPGGFPERHTASLSANPELRHDVALFARSGGILQAECGGLLYLLDELCGEPMCGVLRGTAEMADTLTLGYRDAVVAAGSVAHRAGERRAGHEFHRTHVIDSAPTPAWYWRDHDGHAVREGFLHRNVHASYLHTHPAGQPETVARLVAAARGTAS